MTLAPRRYALLESVLAHAQQANHPSDLLDFVLGVVQGELGATWGAVWLFDRDADMWYIACSQGLDKDAHELRFARGSALPCRVGESGIPLRVGDLDETPEFHRFQPVHYRMRSALYLPMAMGRRPLGVLGLYSSARHAFDADDEAFGSLVTGYVGFAVACLRMRDQRDRLAVLDERDRLAQGLHDGMLQTLSSLRLYAAEVESMLSAGASNDAHVLAKSLMAEVEESIEEVRAAIAALRWVVVYDSVEETVNRMRRRLGAAGVEADVEVEEAGWTPEVSDSLAAVVREAVNNVLKHSQASRCRIALARVGDEAQLTIEDNGVGRSDGSVAVGADEHLGLQLLRERIGLLGGTLVTSVASLGGFQVECRIPLQRP